MPVTLADAVAVAERALGALAHLPVDLAEWKFRLSAPPEASRPDFDDSEWVTVPMDESCWERESYGWYRYRLEVPPRLRGFPTRGRPLLLALRVRERGELYVDGKHCATVSGNHDPIPIVPTAEPGRSHLLALRVSTASDRLALRHAHLTLPEMEALARPEAFETLLRRAVQFCAQAEAPREGWFLAVATAARMALRAADNLPRRDALLRQAGQKLAPVLHAMAETPAFLAPPYLQDMTTTGVTVRWETFGEFGGEVEYREHLYAKPVRIKVAPGSLQAVRLEGLQPGTAYMYRLCLGGITGPWHTFHTAPRDARAVRFTVWGDNQSHPEISEHIARRMAACAPDLCLTVGDIVGSGSAGHQWTAEYLWPLRALSAEVPTYVAMGNHDWAGGRGLAWYERYFTHPAGSGSRRWYAFDYGPARFVVLDVHGHDGPHGERVNPEQFRWLEHELADAARKARWIFLFVHEPPYSECWSGGYYDGEPHLRAELVPLLERYGVDIVFSGHTHDYERGLPHPPYDPATGEGNTVTYIITGGGGGGLDDHKYYEWPQIDIPAHAADPTTDAADDGRYYRHHFCLVEVEGERLQLTAHALEQDGTYLGVLDQFTLQARKR